MGPGVNALETASGSALQAVLLDPHPIWLDAVEVVLNHVAVDVVGKTTSGAEAVRLVEELRPDLLTVEIDRLPGEPDGFDVLRRVRAIAANIRVIVLSAHHEPSHIERALAAGASAYIVKTARAEDVASTVRQAFEHSVFFPVQRAPVSDAAEEAPAPPPSRPAGLTRRELEILKLVVDGHSNAQLARMLWITEQTVKFHLSNVYRKLGVTNRTEAARWAQRNGVIDNELDVA